MEKEPNKGTVPCLVCGKRYNWLTTGHLSSQQCEPGAPDDIEAYREWVAKKHEISPDDTIFEKNQIQKPQRYREHADRLGLPK